MHINQREDRGRHKFHRLSLLKHNYFRDLSRTFLKRLKQL